MINYLAAFATAVTLAITPVLVEAKPASAPKETVTWAGVNGDAAKYQIQKPIEISGSHVPYVLSAIERGIMRKALLKSVRILNVG